MKILIIYFSQTGNTRKVADSIARGILGEADHCGLCRLEEVNPAKLDTYDLVGLGCPVFYYQEPLNVRRFINDLPRLEDQHWFIFCTHGAIIGDTFASITGHLQQKGIIPVGYHDAYADSTMPFYPHPTLTSGHPDSLDLAEAVIFGRKIVKRSRKISFGDTGLIPELHPVPEEWMQNAKMFTSEFMQKIFPPLWVNPDTCTRCLECEAICPVGGINIMADPPVIQDPCIYCWHCVNTCPVAAIEADWDQQAKLAPKLFERYRYWLEVAAEKGEFRWKLDPDSINFAEPYYKQRKEKINV